MSKIYSSTFLLDNEDVRVTRFNFSLVEIPFGEDGCFKAEGD